MNVESTLNHTNLQENHAKLISKNNLSISPKFGYAFSSEHRAYLAYEYSAKANQTHSYTSK